MMSWLIKKFKRTQEDLAKYKGNTGFLSTVCAASALVIVADGEIEASEKAKALSGMSNHETLSTIYKGSEIEEALEKALANAETRQGKMVLRRALEEASDRSISEREDAFMIAADIADVGGIGHKEKVALETIAGYLKLDAQKLLAA